MKRSHTIGPATAAYDTALDRLVDTGTHNYAEARSELEGTDLESTMLLERPAATGSVLSLAQAAEVLAWYHTGTTRPTQGQLKGIGSSMARIGSPNLGAIKGREDRPLLSHTEAAAAARHLSKKITC